MTVSSEKLLCGEHPLLVATCFSDPDSQGGEATKAGPELWELASGAPNEGMTGGVAGYAALCGGKAEADGAGFAVAVESGEFSAGALTKICLGMGSTVSGVVDMSFEL